ncbi:hypothetical protein GOBAR_AA31995 [Gossypium barbadense]|uniref:Uncharacterized protein n=1 Tax=Gossypium barbadense TaxID=3634 RepID=A0A2P5WC83_GOSBA|nr:hypothetical protein GOBAR_AA31995 [Gossypium barbadense]
MVVRELEPKRTSRSMALSDAPQSLPSNEKPIVVIECVEVVENEGRETWAKTWSGVYGDPIWSADWGLSL